MPDISNNVRLEPTIGTFHAHDEVQVPLIWETHDSGIAEETAQGATHWIDIQARCPQCPTSLGPTTLQLTIRVVIDVHSDQGPVAYVAKAPAQRETTDGG